MSSFHNRNRRGFSLMELLAVVTILGIIAAIIVPRVAVSSDTAKAKVIAHHKATINSAVERWYVEKGAWPAAEPLRYRRRRQLLPGRHSHEPGRRIGLHGQRHDAPRELARPRMRIVGPQTAVEHCNVVGEPTWCQPSQT